MGSSGALPQGIFHGWSKRGDERRRPAQPARAFRAKMEEVMTEGDEETEVRAKETKRTFESSTILRDSRVR